MESLTENRVKLVSRVGAALFLILPGIVDDRGSLNAVGGSRPDVYMILLSVGFVCLLIALRFRTGVIRGIELLLVTNICFWCSVGLWEFVPFSFEFGDAESGFYDVFAFWIFLFWCASLYEIVEFSFGILKRGSRRLATIGLIGVVVQVLTSMGFIMWVISGA